MGNTNHFTQIQKNYGQDGIDYVAFRYHERRNYPKIKKVISNILEHANLQKQQALEFIDQEKRQLHADFEQAKNQAQAQKTGSIKQAEARAKQSVQDFSGYNTELKRLNDLEVLVSTEYESKKSLIEKKIRDQIMQKQNKSKLKKIKLFDDKTDQQRKSIENQCIKMHPDKAHHENNFDFEAKYTWESQKSEFDGIFDRNKAQTESKQGRRNLRYNILPSKAPVCC